MTMFNLEIWPLFHSVSNRSNFIECFYKTLSYCRTLLYLQYTYFLANIIHRNILIYYLDLVLLLILVLGYNRDIS